MGHGKVVWTEPSKATEQGLKVYALREKLARCVSSLRTTEI